MVSYKLDNIDKIFISFILLVMCLFCICSTFCDEELQFEVATGLNISRSGSIVPSADQKVFYIPVEKYCTYNLHVDVDWGNSEPSTRYVLVGFSNDTPVNGAQLTDFSIFETSYGSDIDYSFSTRGDYIVFCLTGDYFYQQFNDSYFNLKLVSKSMNNVVDNLVDMLSISDFWAIFETAIPYIAVVVLAAFGFYWVFHTVKEVSKGREKMN